MVHSQIIGAVSPALSALSSFDNVRDFTLSRDGNEAYLSIQSPTGDLSVIVLITNIKGAWTEPVLTSFSGKYSDLEPFLTPDGLRLYFASNRPVSNLDNNPKDFDIWGVERKSLDDEWGDPIRLPEPVNSNADEFYPSVARNNNLYFTSDREGSLGKDDIFCATWDANRYIKVAQLGTSVNTEGYEFNAYVEANEKFIIFSGYNREDGLGSGDLYISYRNEDNQWTPAVNLGPEVNSKYMDYCPYFHPDSKTLYFTSRRSSIEGVNDLVDMEAVKQVLDQYQNGQSRIYKVSVKNILKF